MLVRPLVILLALAVSPLHASGVLSAAGPSPTGGATLAEALAELPAPLTEEAFFEAVNAAGAGIYSVGGAQGTQAMVVTIDITLPGSFSPTAPGAGLPAQPGTFQSYSALDSFFLSGVPEGAYDITHTTTWSTIDPDEVTPIDTWSTTPQPGAATATTGNQTGIVSPPDVGVASISAEIGPISTDATVIVGQPEPDWYTFTIDPPAVAPTVLRQPDDLGGLVRENADGTLTLDPGATGIGLFDVTGLLTHCGGDANDTLCDNAAGVVANGIGLLNQCAGSDSLICTQLLDLNLGEPGAYFIIVDGFGSAEGDGFYTLNITPNAIGLCDAGNPSAGAPPDECDGLLDLTHSIIGLNDACNGITAPPCDQIRPGSILDDVDLSDFRAFSPDLGASTGGSSSGSGASGSSTGTAAGSSGAAASGTAPRSVTVTPGTDPGHFTLTETAPGSGSFRITEAVYYVFLPTEAHQLRSIFAELPAGSVLIADGYRIRPAPGGSFLFRNDEGRVYTIAGMPSGAPPDWYPSLIELTPDSSDTNKTVLTGEDGTRVTIPAPGVELIDINVDPGAIAVTADEITATTESADGGLVALITASGGSTGEVFDLRFFNALNSGKPVIIEGDAIFEPLTDAETTAARNAVAGLMGSVNSVANGPGTAYCVEQDNAVPTTGQLFRFANSAKQRELAFASQVLDGARQVEAAGLLNPDSDATAYTHSIRQWSIWTVEKGFNEASFTESFVEHTRKALEQNGTQWSEEIEDAVRGLAPNRFRDIRRVVERAGLTVDAADDDAALAAQAQGKTIVAAIPPRGTLLATGTTAPFGLLLAAAFAVAAGASGRRGRRAGDVQPPSRAR
jgi:hypothetical protein